MRTQSVVFTSSIEARDFAPSSIMELAASETQMLIKLAQKKSANCIQLISKYVRVVFDINASHTLRAPRSLIELSEEMNYEGVGVKKENAGIGILNSILHKRSSVNEQFDDKASPTYFAPSSFIALSV